MPRRVVIWSLAAVIRAISVTRRDAEFILSLSIGRRRVVAEQTRSSTTSDTTSSAKSTRARARPVAHVRRTAIIAVANDPLARVI